jgi:FtsZ-interacting cell division protein ZipA
MTTTVIALLIIVIIALLLLITTAVWASCMISGEIERDTNRRTPDNE